MSVLRAGAHECQIRSAPVLVLPRLQRFSITLKRRQRAKIKIILALCQQSKRRSSLRLFPLSCGKLLHNINRGLAINSVNHIMNGSF
ncbi:hypothetical protein CTV99_13235 [Bacillus pumilus]|uniref:Uncharacterized protein n=1 Tax=Bacillus pumilus TaxID=1408 RepID=A0A2G8IS71_BACPU|nr:hypothetical protein CTV99_13235 [Bacillus pumilus]